jgi:hypothetical protein
MWTDVVVCLAGVILLVISHTAVAQEVRIGGVSVSIPRRPKTPEKPAPKVETAPETKAAGDGAKTPAPASRSSDPRTQSDPWLDIILEEIGKRKKEVESYEPAPGRQLVTPSTPELFLPAISPRARASYYKTVQMNEKRKSALDAALDSLAAAAAQKLPQYKPDMAVFAIRNPPAENLMLRSMTNGAALKVFKIGIKESGWLIEKNDFGLPLNRYKHGFIWARDGGDDHPYCHLYTVYVQQNYEGGGTYGQIFAKPFDNEIVGCP